MQDVLLTDLIDVQLLQRIQNSFSQFTGMAALTTDSEGNPVTEGSNFTDFCEKYTRSVDEGLHRCVECDKKSGLMALEQGRPVVYNCHAGLVDYASPIMLDGRYLGCFLGGQVRTGPVEEDKVRRIAVDLGLDEEEYLQACRRVPEISEEKALGAAAFLAEIAAVISEMAYKSFVALQQSRRLEKNARYHNEFILKMNAEMSEHVQNWLDLAYEMRDVTNQCEAEQKLEQLIKKGEEFMSTIEDTVEYSKMADEELELREREYNIRDVIKGVKQVYKTEARARGNQVQVLIDDDVPQVLLGDAGCIRQLVMRVLRSWCRTAENSLITIKVRCCKRSYALRTMIEIIDSSKVMSREELNELRDVYTNWTQDGVDHLGGYIIPMLIHKLEGTIEIESNELEGTLYRIEIPQLTV